MSVCRTDAGCSLRRIGFGLSFAFKSDAWRPRGVGKLSPGKRYGKHEGKPHRSHCGNSAYQRSMCSTVLRDATQTGVAPVRARRNSRIASDWVESIGIFAITS